MVGPNETVVATLHQLRIAALTHDAEDGTSTPMLLARSGHTWVRSLAPYTRISAEALARHQAGRDPAAARSRRCFVTAVARAGA